jgi:hypothetical protein
VDQNTNSRRHYLHTRLAIMRLVLPFNLGKLWIVLSQGQAFHANSLFHSKLIVRKFTDGQLVMERDLGDGVVTDVGVRLLAADWTNTTATLKLMNNHDTGTGTLTPSTADTAMQLPTGMTRGIGNQGNSTNIYTTTANVSFTSTFLITEWGLFSATTSGTLWDHKTWSGTSVNNGDILQFVYQLSITSGG